MKIIRLSTFLDFGGIESKMINLSSCDDKENEWVFVAIGKGGDAENKIINTGKKVKILNLNYTIPTPSTIWRLYKFLKNEKPDVLHTSGAEANFFGFIAGKLAGIPKIIVEEIGIPNHSAKAKKIFQYIFRNANWAIGESKIVVDYMTNSFQLNPSKTKVIHNFGVYKYDFTQLAISKKDYEFHLIMISRLEPVKNIEGVIDVVAKLVKTSRTKIKLTIAGSGNSENQLKQKVKDLGLEDSVVFVGFINDPYPYLLNADLYVLNSFSEGFSNSLIEAMYSKTPSLSSAVGAAPDIIQDNVNGFLVPSDNEQALFEKLNYIIKLPIEKQKQIGEKGHQTVTNNFSLEKHIGKLMEIYKN